MEYAPYASFSNHSQGRFYDEPEDSRRDPFRRDCDRVIHCTAFRRLEYKTQVFVNHEGDHYRTRLTHSLEVAQIARAIARALCVNEDLAELYALSHDLGHTPFGHAGEDALNLAMKPYGGFDHNAQTLRILTSLEQRYGHCDGLNLTWEAIEGIAKHNGPMLGNYRDKKRYDGTLPRSVAIINDQWDLKLDQFSSLEAQLSAYADDIAYDNHDIDDGLRAKMFDLDEIRELPLVNKMVEEVNASYGKIEESRLRHEFIRRLIHRVISDVIITTQSNIKQHNIQTQDDIRNCKQGIVGFSDEMQEHIHTLKKFLWDKMYSHYRINRMRSKAKRIIVDMFELLINEPDCLPPQWQGQLASAASKNDKATIIADFIAGMTDRFAVNEYKKLFDMEEL